MSFSTPESGPALAGYLATVRWIRGALDGTEVLERWTRRAADNPGAPLSHLRTLLAVHNADDLVRMDLPWWTYRAINLIDRFLSERQNARVFEFGSGASTLWLARRAASVDSVEHDPDWAERVEQLLDTADDLMARPRLHVPEVPHSDTPRVASSSPRGRSLDFDAYVSTIKTVGGPFDLVLVDGRAREACFEAALERIADDGVVLLDDAQRTRYQAVLDQAADGGWNLLRTRGATPCQPLPRETVMVSRAPLDG